jgi:hypothetical protein
MRLTGLCPEGKRHDLSSLFMVKRQSEPKRPASDVTVGFRNIGKEPHGYSDTDNVLHVVHNRKWRHLDSVDSVLRVRPGFRVSHAKQMVFHSPRNLRRGHLLGPRVVQNLLSGLQCRSLRGSADHRIRRIIQQEHTNVALKVAPD